MKYFFVLFYLVTTIFLTSCSTTQSTRDGAPPYDVDVSKIPDATPKKETLSKYGNPKSYRVYGVPYRTLTSSKNFHEKGIASWYGTKFHSQRTSSGEPYNMLSMTAAHKTLPLPTYVQVTNLDNGRKIIVKVNDRGPFAPNRVIDLSYVAAKKLGMLGRGTAHVDLVAINVDDAIKPNTFFAENTTSHKADAVYLQVGAFKNRVYAEKLKHKLTPIVGSAIAVTKLDRTAKNLYHVKIGPIKDTATADSLTKKLKAIGIQSKAVV